MIEIRPATTDDMLEFYGALPPMTVRAIVAVRDGVIECVAGVTMQGPAPIAFSDMRTDADKMTIWKTAKRMVDWMQKYTPTVLLTPEQMRSDKFLKKLGFIHLGEKSETNIYRLGKCHN